MQHVEAASSPQPDHAILHVIVGQDQQGRWLAIETHFRAGGLFKSRQDALHVVDTETGHRPAAVEMSTASLRLTF